LEPEGGDVLPASHDSLARSADAAAIPGTLRALTLAGGVSWGPKENRTVIFGRNRPEVHVCLGENDLRISRRHGMLTYRGGRWWLACTGGAPIRLPDSLLLARDDEPVPLGAGYTPLFVRGSHDQEHLLEVFITGSDGHLPGPLHGQVTNFPETWPLTPEEKLALVALGQRYLLRERRPQPWTWEATASLLAEIAPTAGWKSRKVEHLVNNVRLRLSKAGVSGLTREEVGEPVGNSLNHNLLQELLLSTTLTSRDLSLLDETL